MEKAAAQRSTVYLASNDLNGKILEVEAYVLSESASRLFLEMKWHKYCFLKLTDHEIFRVNKVIIMKT